jgi:hypothetical protein
MTIRATGRTGLTADNLQAMLADMGTSPGWHAAADLYRWFSSLCEEEGLEPVTANQFGRDLRALGYRSAIRRDCGERRRSWFLTRRAWR